MCSHQLVILITQRSPHWQRLLLCSCTLVYCLNCLSRDLLAVSRLVALCTLHYWRQELHQESLAGCLHAYSSLHSPLLPARTAGISPDRLAACVCSVASWHQTGLFWVTVSIKMMGSIFTETVNLWTHLILFYACLFFNRPGVAGAVLQLPPSLINWLSGPFPPDLQNIITPKP